MIITNIFVFEFGPECDPEYIHIRVKKNIPNIFAFVFGPKKIFAKLWIIPLFCSCVVTLNAAGRAQEGNHC